MSRLTKVSQAHEMPNDADADDGARSRRSGSRTLGLSFTLHQLLHPQVAWNNISIVSS